MNGRTVRKLLMRRRDGSRAFLTVRLPLSLVAPPPPLMTFPGFTFEWDEWFGAGGKEHIYIGEVSSGNPPSEHTLEPWAAAHFVTRDGSRWSWWSGHHGTKRDDGEYDRKPLTEDVIAKHRDRMLWFWQLREYGQHPVLDAFLAAGEWAKSRWFDVDGDSLLMSFSVKWRVLSYKLRFCAGLGRAMKVAKHAGIKARVIYR